MMNKRLKEHLDYFDFKSFFITVAFAAIALSLFFYFDGIQDRFRRNEAGRFKGESTPEIVSIEKLERMSQGKLGTKIVVEGFKVTYQFNTEGRTYTGMDVIPVTVANHQILKNILEREAKVNYVVKFDIEDPTKSLLVVPENE